MKIGPPIAAPIRKGASVIRARSLFVFFAGFAAGILFLTGALLLTGVVRQPSARSAAAGEVSRTERPLRRRLGLPVAGLAAKDIQDTFNETRKGQRRHEATDILSPRGTPVLAIDDGVIRKLFLSKQGGLTVYQFDTEETYCYYYAHLDGYAPGLREGMPVHRGDTLGYAGATGNASANTPHLHLAIFKLGPEKRWWEGAPINPYPLLMGILREKSN